ncbi:hypothetical protein MKZ87_07305 [Pseudomonas sp. MCal1]|uniref:hypothetical protein n=1 Tax=Pseudomonas sp. MCal1 TaxID=2919887 RepID=UPI00224D8FFA|nr:hypothetical protein [Pseudomonas sp. MCal1]MCX4217444.1 hypothetical protein [Pseudomonas sp. MCal1]
MDKRLLNRIVHNSIWALWTIFIVGASLWLLVGSVAYWVRKGWLPADSAGWAQAIGAFVAIVVALALPYFQNRQQQRERRESNRSARLESFNATYALMDHMEGLYKRLEAYTEVRHSAFGNRIRGEKTDSLLHELNQAAAMLREIPVTAISNQMVIFVIGLREVANFGEFVSGTIHNPMLDPLDIHGIRNKVLANRQLIMRWMNELDELEEDVR